MKYESTELFYANYKDEPAILFGNGPSLKLLEGKQHRLREMNLIQIGMNRSWQLWRTNHHVIMFHKEHFEDILDGKWKPDILWAYTPHADEYSDALTANTLVPVHASTYQEGMDPLGAPLGHTTIGGRISMYLDEGSEADMTGQFALEVALWMKCNPIYLIGYDLFGGHFCNEDAPEGNWQDIQVELFNDTADQISLECPNVKVYNLSTESLIENFEKLPLEEFLDGQT